MTEAKLTRDVMMQILGAIRAGAWVTNAVAAAGIGRRTFYTWRRRGQLEKDGLYRELFDEIQKAEATAGMEFGQEILDLSRRERDWKGVAWFAKKRFPSQFGDTPEVHMMLQSSFDSFLSDLRGILDDETFEKVVDGINRVFDGVETEGVRALSAGVRDPDTEDGVTP